MFKKQFAMIAIVSGLLGSSLYAAEGIVNFSNCVMESKYGKHEQDQLEKLKKQWSSLIEETEKEYKTLSTKLEDQNYLDGLSPEAIEELKVKQKTLNDDILKYQNQLYQILNQANYALIQKMFGKISEASEKVALQKKLSMLLNKEACFYYDPQMDVTALVIDEMNKSYDLDVKNKKISLESEAKAPAAAPVVEKKADASPAVAPTPVVEKTPAVEKAPATASPVSTSTEVKKEEVAPAVTSPATDLPKTESTTNAPTP